jgi:hypothetical protein
MFILPCEANKSSYRCDIGERGYLERLVGKGKDRLTKIAMLFVSNTTFNKHDYIKLYRVHLALVDSEPHTFVGINTEYGYI